MRPKRFKHSCQGATVLEMVVVLAIIVLFAGIVVPEVKNYFADAKAARIVSLYQELADGAMKYWADTGQYAYESSAGMHPEPDQNHQLFYKPIKVPIPGWSGPYCQHPLTVADSPFNSDVVLSNDIFTKALGFDLDADGDIDIGFVGKTKGNLLYFIVSPGAGSSDPSKDPIVQRVDAVIDGKTFGYTLEDVQGNGGAGSGNAAGWATRGRAKIVDATLYLYIFTMDLN